jgi:hypothetical protein
VKKKQTEADRLAQGKEIDQLIMLAFETYCKEYAKRGFKKAVMIARLADKEGMNPSDVVRFPDLLEKVGLDEEDIRRVDIDYANEIHNKHCAYIRAWIKKHADGGAAPTIEGDNQVKLQPKQSKSKRPKIFEYPVTAVLRWMGVEGYNFQEAKKVLKQLDIDLSDITIKIQLKAGKDKDESRGEPAPITKQQANKIFQMIDE